MDANTLMMTQLFKLVGDGKLTAEAHIALDAATKQPGKTVNMAQLLLDVEKAAVGENWALYVADAEDFERKVVEKDALSRLAAASAGGAPKLNREERRALAAEKQRLANEAAEKQRLADEAAKKQRRADAAAEKQRLADAAAEKQRLADEAAEKQRLADAAAHLAPAPAPAVATLQAEVNRLVLVAHKAELESTQTRWLAIGTAIGLALGPAIGAFLGRT